jgi:pimeloyl-ACP methyl ester carboxylesterase
VYIGFYMEMGSQLILWNYRGYGQSVGEPSISNSMEDAKEVYAFAKKEFGLEPEIVHGYSIGGPSAVALALACPIKTLVVDRTFCNFVNVSCG